jgi:predicted transcriptional regulator
MSPTMNVKVKDLMQTEVITLRSGAPITEAIETFEECGIQGAPVLDEAGNLLGVLTASDIAKTSHLQRDRIEQQRGSYYFTDPLDEASGDGSRRSEEFIGKDEFSPELLGEETIGDWMTPRVISVGPEESLVDVCKLMTSEAIHRVLVVDGQNIVGIVSTFDVVRHIASLD